MLATRIRIHERVIGSCRVATKHLTTKAKISQNATNKTKKAVRNYSSLRDRGPNKASIVTTGALTLTGLLSYLLLDKDQDDTISVDEVKFHNRADDCWIVVNGNVYDVTRFLNIHPGGMGRIFEFAGSDASIMFNKFHSDATLEKMKEHVVFIGKLRGQFKRELSSEEAEIEQNMMRLPSLKAVLNLSDFEGVAKNVLPKSTLMFYATGSSDEFTLRENHYAYKRVFFRPKILQDVSETVDTSTTFLGTKVDLPVYISAFAGSRLAHPRGEMNLQAAAYNKNVMQMVPKQNSFSVEEFYSVVPNDQNQWFQYHFNTKEELKNAHDIVQLAESLPSIKGIFFNVDLADIGNREKDSRQRVLDGNSDVLDTITDNKFGHHPVMTWKHIEEIVSSTTLPVALKGVQRGEDVVLAAEKGVKAVVLSNHGGRQLDFSRPPLEVLAEAKQMLKSQNLEDKIEIYLDGGVRRGSDVLKALCLGAKGVGLGRPFLYAMAGYGEDGVNHLIEILRVEIENNMRLLGVDKISDLDETFIDPHNLKLRNPKVSDTLYDDGYIPMSFPKFR